MALVGVEKVLEFVHSLILTGRIKGFPPVSAMLIAEPENGKTSIVLDKSCSGVAILTDVTGKGLQFLCQMNSTITHFVVNDMLVVTSHNQRACQYFFSILSAVMEEGIRMVAGPQGITGAPESGRRGFIGCITSTSARDHRAWWHRRGIARRMVPFHYQYPQGLILTIKTEIDHGRSGSFYSKDLLRLPVAPIEVTISKVIADQIRMISDSRATKLEQLGISLLKNYRLLAQGHALLRSWKKPQVTQEDIEFLKRIDPYVDWSVPAIL